MCLSLARALSLSISLSLSRSLSRSLSLSRARALSLSLSPSLPPSLVLPMGGARAEETSQEAQNQSVSLWEKSFNLKL